MLVEEEQNHRLVTVSHKGIILALYKYRLNFNASMLVEPLKVTVAVLVLIEGFEFACNILHFWR